jgi:uncharacterized membrane protein YciS (DUF1049 family)
MDQQNIANHGRFFPPFHFFVIPVMLINFFWCVYRWWKSGFSLGGFEVVLLAAGLLMGFLTARLMALKVQDRVIRLEERLRYERLLPADLQARAGQLEVAQMISLRFASDAELPALARKVLDEKMTDRKAIKQMVQEWRPDHLRA